MVPQPSAHRLPDDPSKERRHVERQICIEAGSFLAPG
jgi:hypothetical protein